MTTNATLRGRNRSVWLTLEALEQRNLLSTYSLTDLSALIGPSAQAYDISDAGELVGAVNGRGFLYRDGTVIDLGTLGGDTSEARGINNWGGIVGTSSSDGTTPSAAFLWYDGVMYDLGLGEGSTATAINDLGQIVGTVNGSAYLWQEGVLTDLGNLGGPGGSSATAINNLGQAVGSASSSAPGYFGLGTTSQAFVWQDGAMTSLGGLFSSANAINNLGAIVGATVNFLDTGYGAAFVQQAFYYNGSSFVALPIPSIHSNALDINDNGQIVGSMSSGAFVYDGGVVRNLNHLIPPGAGITLWAATDINNAGQIIALASDGRYYLLTPDAPVEGPEAQVWVGGLEISDDGGVVDFGGTLQGAPVTRTIVIRNVGSEPLTLTGPITLSAGYTLVSGGFTTATLAPGEVRQLVVRLTATSTGLFTGQLSFGTNDADEDPYNFTLTGSVARIIDDGEAGFTSAGFTLLSGQGFRGDLRRAAAGSGAAQANWTFNGLAAGTYRISASWAAGADRASNAPFTVLNGATIVASAAVDQRQPPGDFIADDVAWHELGSFTIGGGSLVVRLTNLADGWVIADSIRLERLS